jgi:very-short-patch-repair endonuclease
MTNSNTVLVAIMNSKKDFEIANTQKWYRIPVKPAPKIVKEGSLQIIAFYHTKVFENQKYSIQYYGIVTNISIVKRNELFPEEPRNEKTDNDYYKINFQPLLKLEHPIISRRGRRIVFIPTSKEKFFRSTEINQLFNDSILEDILWERLVDKKIAAERQLFYKTKENTYYILDFAIYCKTRNIDVECDGDKYHTGKMEVQYDKNRNNFMESQGWSVLRFTTESLNRDMDKTVNLVCETVNKYGGVQDEDVDDRFHYIRPDNDPQFYLFE